LLRPIARRAWDDIERASAAAWRHRRIGRAGSDDHRAARIEIVSW